MNSKYILLLALLLGNQMASAQQEGRMETDRPDQTECPFIVKKGWIQAEWGFNLEKENGFSTVVHPTVLWKYGVAKKFEFRLITEWITEETPLMIPDGNKLQTGIAPLQIGGKIALLDEKGFRPKTSIIFHLAPPRLASKVFQTQKWAPSFRFTMQHTLTEKIGLGYNCGAEWDGDTRKTSWIYTIAPGFNLGKKWYGYLEAFGAISKNNPPQHAIDGGLACYFSENTKLDFSTGLGISKAATDWYAAIGFSFRFNVNNK